jgi:hypothetical protein
MELGFWTHSGPFMLARQAPSHLSHTSSSAHFLNPHTKCYGLLQIRKKKEKWMHEPWNVAYVLTYLQSNINKVGKNIHLSHPDDCYATIK